MLSYIMLNNDESKQFLSWHAPVMLFQLLCYMMDIFPAFPIAYLKNITYFRIMYNITS